LEQELLRPNGLFHFRGRSAAASLKRLVCFHVCRVLRHFRGRSAAASLKLGPSIAGKKAIGKFPRSFGRGLIEALGTAIRQPQHRYFRGRSAAASLKL